MWTFGIKSPKPLAWQQAFMSTFVVGFALFFFTAFQGMGAKVLQVAGTRVSRCHQELTTERGAASS
jgi:SSS family solute:Na+ symporter